MTVTYLLRHAESTYSADYLINGDSSINIPLTAAGEQACRSARTQIPIRAIASCIASPFPRCRRTAELLLLGNRIPIHTDPRLSELDYGTFEGRNFIHYARWLARRGPTATPPEAGESQSAGIQRMMHGLRSALSHPGPRLLVTHGLVLAVVRRTLDRPATPLRDVFLPPPAPLSSITLGDEELSAVTATRINDVSAQATSSRWIADLRLFPEESRRYIATGTD